jgi:maltooligosyltrehalose synthase
MTIRGIPMIYYGTEQGFAGGWDPQNREPMFDVKTLEFKGDPQHELYKHIRRLSDIKKAHDALKFGEQRELFYSDEVYAYSRATENQEVVMILNNSEDWQAITLELGEKTILQTGTKLYNQLNSLDVVQVKSGSPSSLTVLLSPNEIKIYSTQVPALPENFENLPESVQAYILSLQENLQSEVSSLADALASLKNKQEALEAELANRTLLLGIACVGAFLVGAFLARKLTRRAGSA